MNVEIRPLQENDAKTSVKWRNDPTVWTHTTFAADHEITLEDELKWIRRVMAETDSYRCAILADGHYVGNIYLTGIKDGVGEYHIFIGDKNFWGKGIAQQASKLLLDHAKHELHLKAVELGVKEDNAAAVHVYEKAGFRRSGTKNGFVRMRLEMADWV